jgi:hypothetical protein
MQWVHSPTKSCEHTSTTLLQAQVTKPKYNYCSSEQYALLNIPNTSQHTDQVSFTTLLLCIREVHRSKLTQTLTVLHLLVVFLSPSNKMLGQYLNLITTNLQVPFDLSLSTNNLKLYNEYSITKQTTNKYNSSHF